MINVCRFNKLLFLYYYYFSLSVGSIVVRSSFELESRKRKSSPIGQELHSVYEGSWAMREPTPPTSTTHSSSSAETVGLEEEENKDEMLDIFQSVIDVLLKATDEEAPQLARRLLAIRLGHHDEIRNKEMRYRLLKHFQNQDREFKEMLGLSRLLDVILDEMMDQVEIPLRVDETSDNLDEGILPVIAKRCPSLRTLHIHCSDHLVGYSRH